MMRKFGFKFFSTNYKINPAIINNCADFIRLQGNMFMELTAVPETSEDEFKQIKKQIGDIEVRIHASIEGFNPGQKNFDQQNKKIVLAAQKAADIFNSQTIIVHPGYGHGKKYLEETTRQFKMFHDERIVVENLPYYDNNGDEMHGCTAKEIAYIMAESGCGFCFDFSHAVCSAIALNTNIEEYLQNLYKLNPKVYHMCDGYLNKIKDMHLHFGVGNYPLKHFLNDYTDKNAYITIETGSGFEQQNDLRLKDYEYLKSLQNIE